MRKILLALLLPLLWSGITQAQVISSGGGCSSNCTFGGSVTITPTPAQTTTTDQAQASGGTTLLPFASTSGIAVGQIIKGTSIPLGDQVASIVATAQITQAANGAFLTTQKVIPMATTAGFAAGQQCTDTTKPTAIGAGNVIASIQLNTSITLTSNTAAASSGAADSITCDPVVTMTAASTAAILAGASINFIANATTVSASSAMYNGGDASIAGNLNVGGLFSAASGAMKVDKYGAIAFSQNNGLGNPPGSPSIYLAGGSGAITIIGEVGHPLIAFSDGGSGPNGTALPAGGFLGFISSNSLASSVASDTTLNRLGAPGALGLSNSTSGAKFKVFSTVDTPTGPTNYADFYIDTITSATTLNMGTEHGGTGTGITAVNWKVDGTTKLDYGVTTASTWTLSAATTITGIIKNTGITADTAQTDATVCVVTGTGEFYYGTGTGGICLSTSGEQFKNSIEPLGPMLNEMEAVKFSTYHYNPGTGFDPSRLYVGPTAQSLDGLAGQYPDLKNLVGYDTYGTPNSVDYLGLVPRIGKALQELAVRVDRQQAEINQLRRKEH